MKVAEHRDTSAPPVRNSCRRGYFLRNKVVKRGNTNKDRHKDSIAKAISLCGQESLGPTLTLLEQDVLQMLVNSNDAMNTLSSCVKHISAYSWY